MIDDYDFGDAVHVSWVDPLELPVRRDLLIELMTEATTRLRREHTDAVRSGAAARDLHAAKRAWLRAVECVSWAREQPPDLVMVGVFPVDHDLAQAHYEAMLREIGDAPKDEDLEA
jgi:hypothetical protein